MATKKRVSAAIAPEAMADILAKLESVRGQLDFLTSLKRGEAQTLMRVGVAFAPFLDLAHRTVNDRPELMAQYFDLGEFNRDYRLVKDLALIHDHLAALTEGVHETLLAASSDAMVNALEVYAQVKQGTDSVPGLSVVAAEMAEFFKRPKRKKAQADQA